MSGNFARPILFGLCLFSVLSWEFLQASPLSGASGGILPQMKRPAVGLSLRAQDFALTKSVILDRPLFREGRAAASPPPIMAEAMPAPRLAGIIIGHDFRQALFEASGNRKPAVLKEGGTIDGWRVDRIMSDQTLLTGPGGTRWLKPSALVIKSNYDKYS